MPELLRAAAQNRARSIGAGADDLCHPIHPCGQRVLHRCIVQDRASLHRVDDRHVERLDQHPVEDRLAGVIGQVEHPPGPEERFAKGRPSVNGKGLRQHPFCRLLQVVFPVSGQVNDVAGDAQPHGHLQRIVRLRQPCLQPGIEGQRLAGASLFGCPVRVAVPDLPAHDAMYPLADLRRRARRLDLPEHVEHAVEHGPLLPLVGPSHPCCLQRLAQEAGVAVQIGPHRRYDSITPMERSASFFSPAPAPSPAWRSARTPPSGNPRPPPHRSGGIVRGPAGVALAMAH